jgi:hypothetical protein
VPWCWWSTAMSDPLDEAAKVTELLFQEALRNRPKVPTKTGFCLACVEPTVGAFCSTECREDYERFTKLNAIRGKSS